MCNVQQTKIINCSIAATDKAIFELGHKNIRFLSTLGCPSVSKPPTKLTLPISFMPNNGKSNVAMSSLVSLMRISNPAPRNPRFLKAIVPPPKSNLNFCPKVLLDTINWWGMTGVLIIKSPLNAFLFNSQRSVPELISRKCIDLPKRAFFCSTM